MTLCGSFIAFYIKIPGQGLDDANDEKKSVDLSENIDEVDKLAMKENKDGNNNVQSWDL